MANVKSVVGISRLPTHIPAKAALLLIERAATAQRSLSAYVADIIMDSLHRPQKPLPRLISGRGPRSDADLVGSAKRVLAKDGERAQARAEQVARQKRTASR